MQKPNIIIVMTDQQRADLRCGCGYALDTMPFLDSWAAEGVDFGRAYTPNPTCMPARVSLFTGRYASCHRVRTNHNAKDACYTADLLDVLRGQGYRTALCGKNHSHRKIKDFDFHESCGHLGYEGEDNSTAAQRAFADFLCTTKHMEVHQPSPGGVEVQHPYRNVSSALKFIDETPRNQPFFAWISFAEPHNPYQVPEPYFNMFPPETLPTISDVSVLPEKSPRYPWLRGVWERVLGEDIEARILRARSNYHGMLRLIDDQFRRLIEGLEMRGIRENTVIVFLSDHGDYVGEYGLIRKGADLPDVLTHIPLAMQGPGIARQGQREDVCVNIVDLLPTLCEMIGAKIPFGVQGRSLVPLLRGEDGYPAREFAVAYSESGFSGLYWNDCDGLTLTEEGACESDYSTFDCLNTWTQCGQIRMARKEDWKIQADMMGNVYLYNLAEDPRELRNLAEDPAYVAVKADMLLELSSAMMRACDPLPAPHYRYRVKQHPRLWWYDNAYVSGDPGVRME